MAWSRERPQTDQTLIKKAFDLATEELVRLGGQGNSARFNVPVFLDDGMISLARACFPQLREDLLEAARA